jgi:hypothetical protein
MTAWQPFVQVLLPSPRRNQQFADAAVELNLV